jgi:ABC-type nitrate/sulfonate/bicarbonate transport system permease component
MLSPSSVRLEPVPGQRPALDWKLRAGFRRLRLFAAKAMWWVLSIGLVVALWEFIAVLQLIDPLILPPPHLFIAEIQEQAQFLLLRVGVRRVGANFVALTAIVASLQRVVIGLALAFVTALVMGTLAFYIKPIGKLTLPTVTLLAPIAPVAWIPFALVAFGIGDGAAIFVVFIGSIFTLTLGTVHHMTHVDQLYINTARVLGASRRQVMQHVILPAILPNLFVIMRLNLFGAWTGVLAAEMVGVNTGLGTIVMVGRQMMNMNLTFLGMAMIGLVGYLLDAGFGLIQTRVLWWKSMAQL